MQVQELTQEKRLQQWRGLVSACRSSGKSIKDWCSENEINLKTYYHWQKWVCQATCRDLIPTQTTKVRLEAGCFQWPRTESEVKHITWQQFRWLLEGLTIDPPRAHKPVGNIHLI